MKLDWQNSFIKNIHYSYLILKMCITCFVICKSLLKPKEPSFVPFYSIGAQNCKKNCKNTVYVFQQWYRQILGCTCRVMDSLRVLRIAQSSKALSFRRRGPGFESQGQPYPRCFHPTLGMWTLVEG